MDNKKRLIDANALLMNVVAVTNSKGQATWSAVSTIDILTAPTVDAVEVVHGRWNNKQTNSIFMWHLECSVCGADYNTTVGYNYCPNCGAKMDGDGNE